jgi:proline iminopeptidase
MKLRKFAAVCLIAAGLLLAALAAVFFSAREQRRSAYEDVGPHGVRETVLFDIRHSRQALHLRGYDRDAPLLLFLPGGPGESFVPLAQEFGDVLERHFIVVHPETNGLGASRPYHEPPSFDLLVDDVAYMVERLCRSRGRRGVYLVGHSFGSALALRVAAAHPQRVLGVATVGQTVDWPRGNQLAMAHLLELAKAEHNTDAQQQLQRLPATLTRYDDASMIDFSAVAAQRKWLQHYGLMNISARHSARARWWTYLTSPVHTLSQACGLIYRFPCTLIAESPSWWARWNKSIPGIVNFRALQEVPRLDMPYVAIVGVDDWITPVALVREYHAALQAPAKRLVEIPGAQHYAFLDQPAAFQAAVLELLAMRRALDVALGP